MQEINFNVNQLNFEKARLKFNPFPTTALPEENPSITADRDIAVEKFVQIVNNLQNNHKSSVAVFVGDWGSGKSHLLRVCNTAVREKLYTTEGGVFPILIRSPGRSMLDFLNEIFLGISRARLTQLSNQIVKRYIETNRQTVQHLVLRNYKQKFSEGKYMLDELLEEIQIIDLFKKIRRDLPITLQDEDLFYAILFLSQVSSRIRSWSWIAGSKLSSDDKKRLNIMGDNDGNRKAKAMLKDLVQIILHAGYDSTIIFIDEFENIATVPSNQRKIFQDDLRDVIDEFNEVALIVAVTPSVWQQFEEQTTALTRRLRSNLVQLTKFGNGEIKELLEKYLKKARIEDNTSIESFPNCELKFVPFTNDAIELILKESQGIVSNILEDCKKCLDVFIVSDEEEISETLVKKTLDY